MSLLTSRTVALVCSPGASQVLPGRLHPLLMRLLHDGIFMRRILSDSIQPCVPFRRYLRAVEVPLRHSKMRFSSQPFETQKAWAASDAHLSIVYATFAPTVRCSRKSLVVGVSGLILPDSSRYNSVVVAVAMHEQHQYRAISYASAMAALLTARSDDEIRESHSGGSTGRASATG